ncbi:MAG: hypothetical protein NTZ46_05835 [Verrucomicrobia bacterium]|nr:hypothetical protein [Verrucomicrobiota bacterium]
MKNAGFQLFPTARLKRRLAAAFTLVELLVVIGIMLLMGSLLVPALNGIKGAQDITKTAYSIAGILDQARTYAQAHNTFVWVGIAEVDMSKDSMLKPQVAGVGRVALAVVAAKDGTRGYDVSNASLPEAAWANYNNGANLVAIAKLQYFDNVHLAPLFSALPNSGGLERPTISSTNYIIGHNDCKSVTPFDWPLGTALKSGQYSFAKVINFDPQGVGRIQYSTNQDTLVKYMEIGLIPTHGNVVPATTPANVAAIQIDSMTGATRIYRP